MERRVFAKPARDSRPRCLRLSCLSRARLSPLERARLTHAAICRKAQTENRRPRRHRVLAPAPELRTRPEPGRFPGSQAVIVAALEQTPALRESDAILPAHYASVFRPCARIRGTPTMTPDRAR